MTDRRKWLDATERDVQRLEDRERMPAGWFGLAFYGGTVGLLFIVPIVAGAYLGRWLDDLWPGYSVRWTVSGIVLGIAIGSYNAFQFMRRKQ